MIKVESRQVFYIRVYVSHYWFYHSILTHLFDHSSVISSRKSSFKFDHLQRRKERETAVGEKCD